VEQSVTTVDGRRPATVKAVDTMVDSFDARRPGRQ
jgi:hypothetical protein